jgi:dihydropyrimidinase
LIVSARRAATAIRKARCWVARPRRSGSYRTAIPGLETRLALLFSEGVGKGRIDLQAFVVLTSTNPARMYGLHPRKGTIAVGSDADIVIWDDDREVTISNDMLHHNVDYTPYEGMRITGWPRVVLCRGEAVFEDGEIKGREGYGQFLPCDPPEKAIPLGRSVTDFQPA